MGTANSSKIIIESVIQDRELIIHAKGVFNHESIGASAKDFTPDLGDISQLNSVCVDLSQATRLNTTGVDCLNAYYHLANTEDRLVIS